MTKTKAATPEPTSSRSILMWAVPAVVALVVLAGAAFVFYGSPDEEEIVAATPDVSSGAPAEPGLVARVESLYNDIYLRRREDGYYMLMFGAERLRYVESIVNADDETELPVYYTQSMTAGLAFPEKLESAAIVGLGGGRTAWYVHKYVPELKFTAIELDPEVARIADRYFGVREEENFGIIVRDGRVALDRSDDTYDLIFVDAYRGPFVPFHLLTTEFYELVAERLNPGGVVVQNVEPSTMLFDSAVATIGAAFDNLHFISGKGNIVIVGYDGPRLADEVILERARQRQDQYGFRYELPELVGRAYEPEWDATAEPLTDDWAPVEFLKAIERHNEKQT